VPVTLGMQGREDRGYDAYHDHQAGNDGEQFEQRDVLPGSEQIVDVGPAIKIGQSQDRDDQGYDEHEDKDASHNNRPVRGWP